MKKHFQILACSLLLLAAGIGDASARGGNGGGHQGSYRSSGHNNYHHLFEHAKRPHYGGGAHRSSHGGSFPGGTACSHKGGHYVSPKAGVGNHYGRHK